MELWKILFIAVFPIGNNPVENCQHLNVDLGTKFNFSQIHVFLIFNFCPNKFWKPEITNKWQCRKDYEMNPICATGEYVIGYMFRYLF